MTVQWDNFRYYCPKCFNAFLLEIKNKEFNVEVKCPKCGFILRKKSEVEKCQSHCNQYKEIEK